MTVSDGSLVSVNHNMERPRTKKTFKTNGPVQTHMLFRSAGRVWFGLQAKLTKESREELVGIPGAFGIAD